MVAPFLSLLKLVAVLSLAVLLKSCSGGAGLSGSSGKSGKSKNSPHLRDKGGSSDHDLGGKGGGPDGDSDIFNNGKGGVQKKGEQAVDPQSSPGVDQPLGEDKKKNDELLNFDPQFKGLSNEQFMVSSETTKKPLDLIVAVDTSGSMGEEALKVQQNVSVLTAAFGKEKGLDYHIWVMADNVLPAGVDPTKTTQIQQGVGSNNALGLLSDLMTGTIPNPKPFRPDTQKAFVVVTDDNAENVTSAAFISRVQGDPRFKGKTSFNGLIWIDGVSKVSPTCEPAAPGAEYITLAKAQETPGMVYDLCANDWNPLFVDLGKRLIQQSVILEYKLKVPADPKGSFVVGVNGSKMDPSSFRYDEAKNAIVFAEGKAPPVGSAVVVAFKPK